MEITIDDVLRVIKNLKRHKIHIQVDGCAPSEVYDLPICDLEYFVEQLNEAVNA